jgi:hypothetical protein
MEGGHVAAFDLNLDRSYAKEEEEEEEEEEEDTFKAIEP